MSKTTDSLAAATNIPFPEFTAALIEGVFNTVIEMNIKQTEQYLHLVKEVSMTLTDYINNTKDDVSPLEILDHLDNLPKIEFESTTGTGASEKTETIDLPGLLATEIEDNDGTLPEKPSADLQKTTPAALNALNKQMDIPGIINAGAGAVVDITGAISSAVSTATGEKKTQLLSDLGAVIHTNDIVSYDPVKFEEYMDNNANAETNIPFEKISIAKIYDAIAANVSANKYGILQEMVKLGLVRVVIDNGLIETAMTFESITTEVHESAKEITNTHVSKVKYKRKQRRGIFARLISGKDKRVSKSINKGVNVSTYKERHLNSQTERGSLMGRSVIHWHTDYVPVREA